MRSAIPQQQPRGFTLVELLIVVIILAILAAIVVPQFSATTTDAQESALDANLAAMRSAIELYKAQHNGVYPGAVLASGATCPTGGTASTAAAGSVQAFTDQLIMATNASGQACTVGDSTFKFGPYLRKGIPAEPINNSAAVAITTTGVPITPTAATGGWAYDTKSGQIVMNSNAQDSSKSKLYSGH
jgi:prepilin-type N-terminal cleavage/methylation domain-containing protein